MTLGEGQQFAGYTVVRVLGSGGMGQVYLAQHPRLPRQEALKILRPEISTDESFRQRFIREADSVAALDHPHIVTVFDRGETDGRLWIATQYIDGADAGQLLRERYPAGMPVDEVLTIITAIAEALDYAHGRGILHRDVKPANILLADPDDDGRRRVFLADFGIARPLDDPAGLTATNFTVGTVAYAAPEQLMGNDIDGRADQYALAATAYHLLTGTPLYPESNPVAVISRHLAEPPPTLSSVRAELAPLDAAFARALAKQPGDRFASCRDFARAIAAIAERSGAGYSAAAPTKEAPAAARRPSGVQISAGRSKNVIVMIGAAAVVAGALAALAWKPWNEQTKPENSLANSVVESSGSATLVTPTETPPTSNKSTPVTPTQTSTADPRPTYPPAGALGSTCSPSGGRIGTGPDGTIYHCARVQYTDAYEWSLTPGVTANTNVNIPQAGVAPPPQTTDVPNEQDFLVAASSLPMYVRGARNGGDAGLLNQGYKACAALDQIPNALQAAYLAYPGGNTVDGRITNDGMNMMLISATYLCPRNAHLF